MDRNIKNGTKISGYLEKKGKKKMISSYKKYWFVLEGGLLLYYRSKDDYETISPCKGSISLGPPCIVKPCPSMAGVFQVQTRIATVTLRAENRDEQNRWMQAIISEISPQKNLQRMSHFRYSMENIPQTKEQIRTATPESESSHNSSEDIIHRLQKMGAQSYNPIGTINKIATLRQKDPKDRVPLPIMTFDENNLNNRDSRSSEHIYERISAELRETVLDEEMELTKKSLTLPLQSFDTLKVKKEENRPKTFIIENDNYAISLQKKDYTDDVKTKTNNKTDKKQDERKDTVKEKKSKKKLRYSKSFFSKKEPKVDYLIVENENYATVRKSSSSCDGSDDIRDVNENNLLKEISKDVEEENAYSIPNFFEETTKVQNYYEDLEKIEYAEPNLEEDRCKIKEVTEEKDKKKTKTKKKKSEEKTDTNKESKLKKRSSFIRRVWKRKDKNKEKNDENVEDGELYETVPTAMVEKVCVTDSAAVQMLSELQNILEQKMPILIEKISSGMSSSTTTDSHQFDLNIAVEEQANILEDCPQNIQALPILPTKSPKVDPTSPVHDVPKTRPLALPPKRHRRLETVKSLDEILDELNVHDPESRKNKVKKLIKRFSEPEFSETDVVLRNCRKNDRREDIDAGELSRLLEELAKVTNAPILTPGVTSSLNGANISDEELSKLLPVKQRRFSEPDYDIPRPHKSLTISQKRNAPENVIGSTRFFGPILKPGDMMVSSDRNAVDPPSQLDSITPDSLESNVHNSTASRDKEDNPSEHKYYKFIDMRTFYSKSDPHTYRNLIESKKNLDLDEFVIENEIYAEPRSISMNFELTNNDKVAECEHNSEVFVDSLELCKNEVSTGF